VVTIQEVWYGNSFAGQAIRVLLVPLSWLYGLGWRIYLLVYKLGIKKPYRASCKVLCIGNFAAGGTGKTPTVIFVANCLREMGIPFVIGCSGYGAPHSADATLAPQGPLNASEWGDEPAELREILLDTPIIVGRARVTAAKLCETEFPGAVLLMDDGFQHMPLAKDCTIILDPTTTNTFTFPAGPYREPRRSGMKRADLVIPRSDFDVQFSALTFRSPKGEPVAAPTSARVLTAIGRPDKFRTALLNSGLHLDEFIELPDHDTLESAPERMSRDDCLWIVTEKDWVKLKNLNSLPSHNILIAQRTATIEPTQDFKSWLKMRLG
jgi:tetraacyldisaccharide 4'-kinase